MAKRQAARPSDEFDFFELDQDRLDEEWVNQPKLYFKYAKQLAETREELEEAKAAVALAEAEMYESIQADPDAYGVENPTVEACKKAVVREMEGHRTVKRMRRLSKDVAVLQAVDRSLEHRKRALEKLVDLRLANYYSSPKEPTGREARDYVTEATDKEVARRARRKRRK